MSLYKLNKKPRKINIMKTEEKIQTVETSQIVELVKGVYTPAEALHVVMSLLDEKINFHKIQRLQLWEGNHKQDTNQIKARIKELEHEKEMVKEFIHNTMDINKKIVINGKLDISIED